jgi:hypothetical protein
MEIFLHGSGDITSINKKYLHRLCSEFEFNFLSCGDGGSSGDILRM